MYAVHMLGTKAAGNRLRVLRLERGLSPEQSGARVGLSGMTIRRLEDGRQKRVQPRTMFRVSQEVGVPVGELFDI